jgi:sulfate/thiosulfate transport system permease protein
VANTQRALTLPRGSGRYALRAVVVLYVGVLVALPVGLLCWRAFKPGLKAFVDANTNPLAEHAFKLSAEVAVYGLVIDTVFGVAMAVLLARYRFPGRRLLDAFVDLPTAVSPIVVGLALLLVYSSTGWFGSEVADTGVQYVGSLPALVMATTFVSMPLVIRAVLPVLEEAGTEQEQAAASLGANAFTTFRRITLPIIRTALGYGVVLSLARCIGEYGAVLVVSGNFEGVTETAPLRIDNLITTDFEPNQAYSVAFVLMVISVLAIVTAALLRRGRKRSS